MLITRSFSAVMLLIYAVITALGIYVVYLLIKALKKYLNS